MATMELDCGISRKRIVGWLEGELGLPREGDCWAYAGAGGVCHVSASPLASRSLGTIELERTLLSACGDQAAVDAFNQLFILRFASAGG